MGMWFEEFEVGAVILHAERIPVTMEDNVAFCRLTRNTQPLHLDEAYAKRTPFGRIVINGLYTFAAAVGVSVPELTEGTLVANLAYEEVEHPLPVHPGDTLAVTSEVVQKRVSSKPGRGLVTIATRVRNQEGGEVCRFRRVVMVRSRPKAGGA